MNYLAPEISLLFATIIFISVVALNLIKKDSWSVWLYITQSLAIASLLLITAYKEFSILLLIAIVATIAVKIIIAPYFFFDLLKKHQLKSPSKTYLNIWITALAMVILSGLTQTNFFKQLVHLAPEGQNFLFVSLATILLSLFSSINKKGALSQMLGILFLENGIVSFALFAGLEQNPALQLGITFNILIWIIIATVFVSMIYQKFGSLDVSNMKHLTE